MWLYGLAFLNTSYRIVLEGVQKKCGPFSNSNCAACVNSRKVVCISLEPSSFWKYKYTIIELIFVHYEIKFNYKMNVHNDVSSKTNIP